MKFDHAVKYNGVFYSHGEDVPMTADDETRIIREHEIINKERKKFEQLVREKNNPINLTVENKSLAAERLI